VAPILPEQANTGAGTVSLANISKLIGTFEVNAVVNALNQTSGSELLSSPTVTVLSGNPANITVAQELRYPQSYGDPRSTASNGGAVSLTPGTPQEFTTRNIGVELKVTPTVEDDDYSISLDLNPRVTEFDGFIEYGGQSVAIAPGNTTGGIISTLTSVTEGGGGQPTVVTVPSGFFQPVFSTREVVTKVTIWDGATLVMGGLTREEVTKVNDSVPILGDIPLIGNLFKSKGESVQKRNLLIFVTANLVSPGGSLKKQDLKNVARDSMFQAPSVTTPGGNDSRVRNTATGK
jgi:general secretion pathway protein D